MQSAPAIHILDPDPFVQFHLWLSQARESGLLEPDTMCLATSNNRGHVTCRTVLLCHFDHKGFVFFTNFESRKAKQIRDNPCVALLFSWLGLRRQVEITGIAKPLPAKKSMHFLLKPPIHPRIEAWLCYERKARDLYPSVPDINNRTHTTAKISPKWGAYRVAPKTMEFWQESTDYLHDRFLYKKRSAHQWQYQRI